jgi:zinc protease
VNAIRILVPAALAVTLVLSPSAAIAIAAAPSPQPPALHLPVPVERTLPNGLRVVVFAGARLPIVHMQLLVNAGSATEPDDQAGVAALTLALLRQGTASRSADELAAGFSQLGATFVTSGTRDYALVACGARAEAFESTLELMSDPVLNPLFGGDDFPQARLNEARRAEVQHGSLADVVGARLAADVFGPHPYAHDPAGDPRALATIDLPAVQAFYRDRWRPDRAVLVIAGDVTADRAFAVAGEWFGRWAGHAAADRARPAPQPATGVHLIDVPGSGVVEVRVAVPGPGMASPEHDAWALATAGFESIRLPEGARTDLQDGRDASMLVLSATTTPAQGVATAQAMVRALEAYAAAPPAGEALAALRRRVAQRYPLTLGTLGAFVSQWQALDFAGAPAGSIADLGTREAAADPGAGLRALASPPVVLVAGPAATLRAPLEAAGLGALSLEEAGGPLPAAGAVAPASVTPEMRRHGKAVLAAAVVAHGGAAALQAMKTLVIEGTITLRMNGEDMAGQFSAARQDPDRFSFATKVLNLESRQLCSGNEGWAFLKTDSTTVMAIDSLGIRKLHASAASDLVHELRMASGAGGDPVWRGTEMIGDRNCDLVEFTTPYGRQRLSVDIVTHRVLELGSGLGPRGIWLDRRVLSDFRRVNGLLLPFAEERALRGERTWRMAATTVLVNSEIPPALFARPAVTRP